MRIAHIFFTRMSQRLVEFLQVQLLLSITALPILVHWGLPISYATIAGNLLFAPFLTLFLLLSSIMFMVEILHLPKIGVAFLLEKLSALWLTICRYSSPRWLFSITNQHTIALAFIVGSTAIALCYKKINTPLKRVIVLSCILSSAWVYARILSPKVAHTTNVSCSKGHVKIIYNNGNTIVIDPGYCSRLSNPSAWIEYTLLPTLHKTCGTTTIDHYIVLQPSARMLDALATACTNANVETLWLPYWKGSLSKYGASQYRRLLTATTRNGTTIGRLANRPVKIENKKTSEIIITPLKSHIKSPALSYRAYKIDYNDHMNNTTLYSARYKIKKPF